MASWEAQRTAAPTATASDLSKETAEAERTSTPAGPDALPVCSAPSNGQADLAVDAASASATGAEAALAAAASVTSPRDGQPQAKSVATRTKRARKAPVETTELLKLPSYSSVRFNLIEDPARHLPLPGAGKAWIAEGLNDELGAGAQGIHTTRSHAIATHFAAMPLGSRGAVKRAVRSGEMAELSRRFVMRPGVDVRHAPDQRTGIRSQSVARAVIYQANFFDPDVLAAEIRRVCVPGAHVTLCGLGPCSVNKAFDDVFVPLYAKALRPLWSAGERQLLREFSRFPLELEDSVYLMNVRHRLLGVPKQYATAKWTFAELLSFLRTYPSIQRIERPFERAEDKAPAYEELRQRFANGLTAMKEAWDGPRKARVVRWPLWLRSGFLPR